MKAVNLAEGQYFGSSVFNEKTDKCAVSITEYNPQEYIHEHSHENAYISILMSGNYSEKGAKENRGVFQGEILFRPAGYRHENRFQNLGGRCLNIELKNLQNLSHLIPEKFVQYGKGLFPYFYKLYFSLIYDLHVISYEECIINWASEIGTSPKQKSNLRWVKATKEILDNELKEFHSLADLSERVHVHPVYLSRGFKQRTGVTVREYQMNNKLVRAFKMLVETDKSISTITHTNGFFDDAHFIRTIKSFYGLSPHQFRLHLKN